MSKDRKIVELARAWLAAKRAWMASHTHGDENKRRVRELSAARKALEEALDA